MPGNNVLALDIGEKRVGVAFAREGLMVPTVLTTLERQASGFWESLAEIIKVQDVGQVVVGLPRGLDGQETAQTKSVRSFATTLQQKVALPIHWQDEALTSVHARDILISSGKSYAKGDVDGVAASLILADYLEAVGGNK